MGPSGQKKYFAGVFSLRRKSRSYQTRLLPGIVLQITCDPRHSFKNKLILNIECSKNSVPRSICLLIVFVKVYDKFSTLCIWSFINNFIPEHFIKRINQISNQVYCKKQRSQDPSKNCEPAPRINISKNHDANWFYRFF